MEGPQKFIDWLLEMGYLEQDDIPTDKEEIIANIRKVRTVAPKFYNICVCATAKKGAMTMTWNEITRQRTEQPAEMIRSRRKMRRDIK